jgi:propionate catabolism operon transcriptional regulator
MTLPPLRERPDDQVELAGWCLKNALAAMGLRPHANLHAELLACSTLLAGYGWPGNVRELRNMMERVALYLAAEPLQALSPGLLLAVAPELMRAGAVAPMVLATAPAESLTEVLARFDGNREAAAKYLGVSRTTLWRKLRGE